MTRGGTEEEGEGYIGEEGEGHEEEEGDDGKVEVAAGQGEDNLALLVCSDNVHASRTDPHSHTHAEVHVVICGV